MKAVIFSLGLKEYGVDLVEVREVIRLRTITHMPDTPTFIEGVISLRGKIIPVVDMAVKLGLPKKAPVKTSRIIIVKIDAQFIGVRVDAVASVMMLAPAQMTPPGDLLKTADYLTGIARLGERLIFVVSMDKLLREDMTSQVQKIRECVEIREKK